MKAISVNNHIAVIVDFTKPEDVFHSSEFTIVGACPESDLIVVGLKDQQNTDYECFLSAECLEALAYDDVPRGHLLITKNNVRGDLIDVTEEDLRMFQS